jgi:sterol desaturase/sphingolipid hydroxylase (fatty acid hydroxylase superfamily)
VAVVAWAVSWGAWAVTAASFAGWAAIGALAWTLGEYALHRLDMHGRRSRGATRREHRRHHATVDVPALTVDTWTGAAIVAVAMAWWGPVGLGVGWMGAYVGYELLHRSLHQAVATPATEPRLRWAIGAPRRRHRRWALGHHLHHHHVDARRNYGVTTPLWDHVFRTYARPTPVGASAAGPRTRADRPGTSGVRPSGPDARPSTRDRIDTSVPAPAVLDGHSGTGDGTDTGGGHADAGGT